MLEFDKSLDPDLWDLYKEIRERYKLGRERGYSSIFDKEYYQIQVLEELIKMKISKLSLPYLRPGEPNRVTIADVIAYHDKLDRQYGHCP